MNEYETNSLGTEEKSTHDQDKLETSHLPTEEKMSFIGKSGALINIVFGISLAFFWIIFSIVVLFANPLYLFLSIPIFIATIIAVVTNSNHLRDNNRKISAGILGLIFCAFIGGILVFFG